MRRVLGSLQLVVVLSMTIPAWSASKPHVVFLGKPQTVKIFSGRDESRQSTMTVRPLYVDTKLKDYTTGDAHDLTDHQFAVQRAYRLNDSLPGDSAKQSKWIWQRGDWLIVDRVSGRVAQLKLPEFDAPTSHVSWYRDYAAYCGVSDNGVHSIAVVAQVGVRKPLFRKELDKPATASADTAAGDCSPAKWEKHPPRVSFSPANGQPFVVNVVPHHAEEMSADNDAEQ